MRESPGGELGVPLPHTCGTSPRREELAGAQGITARLFRDPQGSNRVGIILEVPDMATFEKMLEADPTWESAKADGVRVDTAVSLHEV